MALERHPDPVDHIRGVDRGQAYVPLEPVEQRAVREVRRAHERRGQPGLTLQQPCFGVQLGRPRIERNPHFGAKRHQFVDSPLLRHTHVRRRNHPDSSTAANNVPNSVTEMANARPDHERAQQIDRVSAHEFGPQLGADVRLPDSVDEQITLAEGRCRQRRQRNDVTKRRSAPDPVKDPSW
jgi:hypothetical protein